MITTSIFIVGTRNANGADYKLAHTKDEACRQFRDRLDDGFSPFEILCLEGLECPLRIDVATVVSSVRIV